MFTYLYRHLKDSENKPRLCCSAHNSQAWAKLYSLQTGKKTPFYLAFGLILCFITGLAGCRSPASFKREADQAAYAIIKKAQEQTLPVATDFEIETPAETLRRKLLLDQNLPYSDQAVLSSQNLPAIPHWPKTDAPATNPPPEALPDNIKSLTLAESLQIAAHNNRDYQTRKEDVFRSALALDLEANQFRGLLAGNVTSDIKADHSGESRVRGLANTGKLSLQRRLKYGTLLTTQIAVDLVKLLTLDRASSLGLFADATISIPILRGAGKHIVAEPLTQAEQNLIYSLFAFERYKQTLSSRVATEYMSVIQQMDQIDNAADNYRRLTASAKRALRLADAGRLPQIQVDQAVQDELRARDRWISARQSYAGRLDQFKMTLGLPTDAEIDLDRSELQKLAQTAGLTAQEAEPSTASGPMVSEENSSDLKLEQTVKGPLELEADQAVSIALQNRLDLQSNLGKIYDAQRQVVVAADALRLGIALKGSGAIGEHRSLSSAGLSDAQLNFNKGTYAAGLAFDLPLERTTERNAWRNSLISLERAVRDAQNLEDQIKLDVRGALREMLQARESYRIQQLSLAVAERRVNSTDLFLEAGRAQVRDLLEAQEALVSARNSLTSAMINYRAAEIKLQRDMGVLNVDPDGQWQEYKPELSDD